MGRNSCRLEMALPAPVQPPNWLGAAPLARLRVQATGGVGRVQVARRPPGVSAGREAAAAGCGGSGPAASSCSPPAWGSAGRAGRSQVRAPTSLPRPFPGRPRADSARRGWERRARAGVPCAPRAGPAAIPTLTLRPGSRSARGAGGGDCSVPRRDVGAAGSTSKSRLRGAGPRRPQPGRGGSGRAWSRPPRRPRVRGFAALALAALRLAE